MEIIPDSKSRPALVNQVFQIAFFKGHLFRQNESAERYQKRYNVWKKEYADPEFHELVINIGFLEEEVA